MHLYAAGGERRKVPAGGWVVAAEGVRGGGINELAGNMFRLTKINKSEALAGVGRAVKN
jgi:hypothetical protein